MLFDDEKAEDMIDIKGSLNRPKGGDQELDLRQEWWLTYLNKIID